LLDRNVDERVSKALETAKGWAEGKASTGDAMKASVAAHAAARAYSDPVAIAIARSAGQAVATAHMADHSLGASLYALKAQNLSGRSIEAERKWQNLHLPQESRSIVLEERAKKEKSFRMK
jgi:hypothetical protein